MEALAIKALTGGGGGVNVIDDTSTSTTKTWSSSKLNEDLVTKQDAVNLSISDGKICITYEGGTA